MPKYLCPVTTCNREFTGSISDIIPPAIGHMEGSHQQDFSEQDILTLIQRQADPSYKKEKISIDVKSDNDIKITGNSRTNILTIKPKQARQVRSNLKVTEEEKLNWWKKMEQGNIKGK